MKNYDDHLVYVQAFHLTDFEQELHRDQRPSLISLRVSHQMKKHNLKVLCHISLINANCAALRMKFVKPVQKGQEQSRNYSKDQQMKEAYTTCIYGTKNNKSCSIKTLRMLILPHKNVFMEVV